jgi:alkyl sulfatase BDS1-like metallo-beta-lactamase superfamily hydrolase
MKNSIARSFLVSMMMVLGAASVAAQTAPTKPATAETIKVNQDFVKGLPWNDKVDFENASKGLIDRPETLIIKDANGHVVWDMESYKKYIELDKPAPSTVNPSLWRNAQLNMNYGLFKVADRIYQVRGYDLSNITFIEGNTGWIVFDPLISAETAKAAYDLVTKNLGKKLIVAVMYSHSHVDHYGGVRGIVSEADVKSGKVKVIAPEGFMEHAISENVTAGNAMARRAVYMYGALLPRNAQGGVDGGLGKTNSIGDSTLIVPNVVITHTGEELTVDGVKMIYQLTPDTEAPAEMNVFFPQFNAMWMAENTTNTLHNLYSLRGAEVRNGLNWAKDIQETMDLYGDQIDVKFNGHHWPMWGNQNILTYLQNQRDLYKYIHDQSVRMINYGMTAPDIAESLKLPAGLNEKWYSHGYYGTVKHDARAVYQKYMGWYDSNPANLDPLPPVASAKKYVQYMGGSANIITKAKIDFKNGEYRWVAEAMKQVVFAEPNNKAAKNLLADALEQLGYQAESGPWRSEYLQGAYELRNGLPASGQAIAASPDTMAAMTPQMIFDYLGVRLNAQKSTGKNFVINFEFPELGERYSLTLRNSALTTSKKIPQNADATVSLSKATFNQLQLGQTTIQKVLFDGKLKVTGNQAVFADLLAMIDTFPFWFNISTPAVGLQK